MIENILIVIYFSVLLMAFSFPVIFAFYKRLDNKILFLSSVYGINFIVWVLVPGSFTPVYAALVFIVPALHELELTKNIIWLIEIFDFVQSWWGYISVLTLFLFPSMIKRRYEFVFNSGNR